MKFYVKVYRVQREVMVAACDENICGKKFEEGNLILDVCKEFYRGELLHADEALSILRSATIANLVGKDIVAHGIKAGMVDSKNVLKVKGVPHAQFALL